MEANDPYDVVLTALLQTIDPVPTLELAKEVLGPTATKAQINPLLYRMAKDHVIERIDITGKPCWQLVPSMHAIPL